MTASWARTPGQGAYARPERERRFLLDGLPDGLGPGRLVEDRYLDGTTLRLRRVSGDGLVVCKLTQKVRTGDGPAQVALTNLYLTEEEHRRLSVLPGADLVKVRRPWVAGLVVDEHTGPLAGLVLAELEVEDLAAPLPDVPGLGREVTHDERFTGPRSPGRVSCRTTGRAGPAAPRRSRPARRRPRRPGRARRGSARRAARPRSRRARRPRPRWSR